MITYQLARTDHDIQGILALQKKNLPTQLDAQETKNQGFVTVNHSFELLKSMNNTNASIIAKDDDQIVGYNIAMTKAFAKDIPVLIPMFGIMDHLTFKGQSLKEVNYIVCGQVCVAKAYRGQGIFDGMYQAYRQYYKDRFPVILTEIATRNTRSLRAHERVGFEIVHSYNTPDEQWEIVKWEW